MSSDSTQRNAAGKSRGASAPDNAKSSSREAAKPAGAVKVERSGKGAAKAPRAAKTEPSGTAKSGQRPRDPRGRMVRAMLELVGEQGYCDTTVAHVIARAEASRKTFYEHFGDIEACFTTVAEEVAEDWLERLRNACEDAAEPGEAMEALVGAVFEASLVSPQGLRVLAAELPAVGAPGIERRERLLEQVGEILNRALIGLAEADPERDQRPQLSEDSPIGRVLAGALLRIPYVRARQGARVRKPRRSELTALVTDVARWMALYRWAPDPGPPLRARDGFVPPLGGRAPGTLSLASRASERRGLPRGESNVSHSFVVHSQRERLLDALANLSAAKGYDTVTIPEIVQEAAVSVQAFYEHFAGREDAFLVAHEVGHRKALAIMERAYEAQVDWPAAMRAAVGALLDFYASESSFAHVALVDVLTAGAKAMELSRHVAAAYADMVRPGIQYSQDGVQRPEIMVEGAVHGLVELCYAFAATERARELPMALDLATHIALDPFVGVGAAEVYARFNAAAATPA